MSDSIDAAWTEVESVLPEGWQLCGVEWMAAEFGTEYEGEPKPGPGQDWRASAEDVYVAPDDADEFTVVWGRGDTPAAALHALAEKLRRG